MKREQVQLSFLPDGEEALSLVAEGNGYIKSCLEMIHLSGYSRRFFDFNVGRIEGYLNSLHDLGHITDDVFFVARDELRGKARLDKPEPKLSLFQGAV